MNIIVISEGLRKGRAISLSHRHLMAILLVGVLLLPLLLGFITFRIQTLLDRHNDPDDQLRHYARELAQQARNVETARNEAATHLNALTRRLGQLQAQVLRLNALGGRLTRMAGLDKREFNFDTDVAQGGPETGDNAANSALLNDLSKLGHDIKAAEARLKALETLLLDRRLSDAVTPAGWPADGGFVSSGFGKRADPFTGHIAVHEGVDIASRLGSPIKAMADGVVSFVGPKSHYGNVVEVNHGNGLVTRYAHASTLSVKEGDTVKRGEVIGAVGSTGRSTGPHLHLEVLREGRAVNPTAYLRAAR
jgi:murein DD-endopeptidase MepM/ murein hydrolase activator NlpD